MSSAATIHCVLFPASTGAPRQVSMPVSSFHDMKQRDVEGCAVNPLQSDLLHTHCLSLFYFSRCELQQQFLQLSYGDDDDDDDLSNENVLSANPQLTRRMLTDYPLLGDVYACLVHNETDQICNYSLTALLHHFPLDTDENMD